MKLSYHITPHTNAYQNIALEEYLLKDTANDECILYLWQNDRTVVVGRNQNLWNECDLDALQSDGGTPARRLSGGGAVYHDMGNLNFTFCTKKDHYDVQKQTEVILQAVRSFGIPAARAGRNDLLVEGKKFSGHAFYQSGNLCYHHGTLLLAGDKALMAKYLKPSVQKLQSKAVDSVKSRVCNLTEFQPLLTLAAMQDALLDAFGSVYGAPVQPYDPARLDDAKLATATARFGSWGWVYGRKIPFNTQWHRRFDFGEVSLQFVVSQGVVQDVAVWTDALDVQLAPAIKKALMGVKFLKPEMQAALGALGYLMEGDWDV